MRTFALALSGDESLRPDLLLLLGDQVYADVTTKPMQDFIRSRAPFERALLLLYLEERSTREIAEVLGIGESNVTTRISRLKQRLREHVRSNHPEAHDGTR